MRQDTLYIGDNDLGSKSERDRDIICEKPSKRYVKEIINLGAHVMKGGLGTSPNYYVHLTLAYSSIWTPKKCQNYLHRLVI